MRTAMHVYGNTEFSNSQALAQASKEFADASKRLEQLAVGVLYGFSVVSARTLTCSTYTPPGRSVQVSALSCGSGQHAAPAGARVLPGVLHRGGA